MANSVFLGIILGIVIAVIVVYGLLHLLIWLRNKNRYDIPKYLPRDDERAWAIAMVSAKRVWHKCRYVSYDDWDLGILSVDGNIYNDYNTKPRLGDVIITPKKWGGYHACVVTRELNPVEHFAIGKYHKFITVYLGEFNAREYAIYDGRDRSRSKVIQ